jgi:transposase-like protein
MPTKLKRKQGALADHRFLDEVFVNIQGQRHYLWRAINQNRNVIDILLQRRRNARAAKRFFRTQLKRATALTQSTGYRQSRKLSCGAQGENARCSTRHALIR